MVRMLVVAVASEKSLCHEWAKSTSEWKNFVGCSIEGKYSLILLDHGSAAKAR